MRMKLAFSELKKDARRLSAPSHSRSVSAGKER